MTAISPVDDTWVVLLGDLLGLVSVDDELAADAPRELCLLRQGAQTMALPPSAINVLRFLQSPRRVSELQHTLERSVEPDLPTLEDLVGEGLAILLPNPKIEVRFQDLRLQPRGASLGSVLGGKLFRLGTTEYELPVDPLTFWVWVWSSTQPSLGSACRLVADLEEVDLAEVQEAVADLLLGLIRAGVATLDVALRDAAG